jgi:hypothetical protein
MATVMGGFAGSFGGGLSGRCGGVELGVRRGAVGVLLYRLRPQWGQPGRRPVAKGSWWWLLAALLAGVLVLPVDNSWCDLALSLVVFPLLIIAAASC